MAVGRSWDKKPTLIHGWLNDYPYLLSLDESGTSELLGIRRALAQGRQIDPMDRIITIAGVIQKRSDFQDFRDSVLDLKKKYWPDGEFNYKGITKRVCFHSREIRKREGPFSMQEEDYNRFLKDLSRLLDNTACTVIAASLDKVKHVRKYRNPFHPYRLCMDFILERFAIFLNRRCATGIVLLESRGKKEDLFVHKHIMRLLTEGTDYVSPDVFQRIKGVYFNPKWDEQGRSFVSLELADLFAYPIHQFIRDDIRTRAFDIVERKFDRFPNYFGYGLKLFPNS